MNDKRICPSCIMGEFDDKSQCNLCQFSGKEENSSPFLPIGTILNDRYYVGKSLENTGETLCYMAQDQEKCVPVVIEEFYIQQCSFREHASVVTEKENLVFIKTVQSEFLETNETIQLLANTYHVEKILSIFSENNTIYVVKKYFNYTTVKEMMDCMHGTLTMETSLDIINQLAYIVGGLHKAGLVHGGISPETVVMDTRGNIVLKNRISVVHGGKVKPKKTAYQNLFLAPEQHNHIVQQGEYTDVYSIGACLFIMLSGVKPSVSKDAISGGYCIAVHLLPHAVPKEFSKVIQQAMEIEGKYRIQKVSIFTELLHRGLNLQPQQETNEEYVVETESFNKKKEHKGQGNKKQKAMQKVKEHTHKPISMAEKKRIFFITLIVTVATLAMFVGALLWFPFSDGKSPDEGKNEKKQENVPIEENKKETAELVFYSRC